MTATHTRRSRAGNRPEPPRASATPARPTGYADFAAAKAEHAQAGEFVAAFRQRDALPFLTQARDVHALSVRVKQRVEQASAPSMDLAMHLSHHGVRVEAAETIAGDIGVGDALLARLADYGADLVVMGAYAHARLRELVLGGVTQC